MLEKIWKFKQKITWEKNEINFIFIFGIQLFNTNYMDFVFQMRKEADDIGPSAELDHWRKRMAKFNRFPNQ